MSIKEIKEKTKLSLDEMFDNKSVGKMESQKDGHPSIHMVGQPTIHPDVHPDKQKDVLLEKRGVGKPENNVILKLDSHPAIQEAGKPETQKAITYKMTFNLSEKMYKAFNEIYAQRIISGNKTEKSELICEAIELLILKNNR